MDVACGQSDHMTLNLTVSQDWTDGMNWLFASWCKSRKAKSYFNGFWLGAVIIAMVWSRMSLWFELIFCMLTVMQYFFARPTSFFVFLTFKCQSIAVVLVLSCTQNHKIDWLIQWFSSRQIQTNNLLDPWPWPEGFYKLGLPIFPSVFPSILASILLSLWKFSHEFFCDI